MLGNVAKSLGIIAVTIAAPLLVFMGVVAVVDYWDTVLHLLKFVGTMSILIGIMILCDVLGWDKRRDQE
jgi:hypothetical protein